MLVTADFYRQVQVVDLYGVQNPLGMPERAVIVIEKEGIIRYIEVLNSPAHMPDTADLFEVLRKL
jgi:peroxiredoxin